MAKNKVVRFQKFKEKILKKDLKIIKMSVHGHGIAIDPDNGKEIHILGAIIGDIVDAKIYRELRGFYFAELSRVRHESIKRTPPRDPLSFYSTSPWQIIKNDDEREIKKEFISQDFARYADTEINSEVKFPANFDIFNYRNKVEYGFWYDKVLKEYMFSCFKRGSGESRIPLLNSAINHPSLNEVGENLLAFLNTQEISPRTLKSCILRCSYSTKEVVIHLIIQDELTIETEEFEKFAENEKLLKGLIITNSDNETLYELGDLTLSEVLLGQDFVYRYDHFFQVHLPSFEIILEDISEELEKLMKLRGNKWRKLLDLFAGVGIFGICLNKFADTVQAIEIGKGTKEFAQKNAENALVKNYSFRETPAENSTDSLNKTDLLIVDPPRTGIDKKTLNAISRNLPGTIIYLSCNPRTQAKDYNLLKKDYRIVFNCGYNLFPQTPHVEHLLILRKIKK